MVVGFVFCLFSVDFVCLLYLYCMCCSGLFCYLGFDLWAVCVCVGCVF